MDKYASMKSFSVHCVMAPKFKSGKAPAGTPDISVTKDVKFQAPNMFDVEVKLPGVSAHAVSDGKTLLILQGTDGITDKAPARMSNLSDNPILSNPVLMGAGLQMVAGSAGYSDYVDTSKGGPVAGAEETLPDGKKALHVKFPVKGPLPNADLLIGEDSKLIYSATYDIGAAGAGSDGSALEEKYSDFQTDPVLAASVFSTIPPSGAKVQSMADMMKGQQAQQATEEKPPVPIGKPAPDFRVFSLANGEKVKLSDLKGKVVLIDFWATWCPPCRESLPHTEDIFKKYGAKNVQVLTVSDEDAETIRKYITDQKFTFPAFRDPESTAEKLYGVTAIPTLVVIDAKGNLAAYIVGLSPEADIVHALKKAGVSVQ
ncbi:MAG TPA: TlpA disulfide reductase family protein [Fimbriimonadaceae bacterium]